MSTPRQRRFFVLGLLAVAASPAAARAQFATLEARAGVVPVAGSYADALGNGQTIGVGSSMRFTPTLSVRLDADAANDFADDPADLSIYSYMLGLETQLLPTRGLRRAPLALSATLSGGASQIRYRAPLASGGASETENSFHPTVALGLRLTGELSRNLGIFAGASAAGTLLGDAGGDASPFAQPYPLADGGTLVTTPLVAGVRIRF